MENIEKKLLQAVQPGRVNFSNLLYNYKKYLPEFDRIDFVLTTYDFKRLPVTLFLNKQKTDRPSPVLIYNHSHGSCRWEASDLIVQCQQFALNLCLYDSRGCGESNESCIYFGFREYLDLLFLILYLNINYKLSDLYLWGRSIGCNTVLQLYQTLISNEGSFVNRKMEKIIARESQNDLNLIQAIRSSKYPNSDWKKYPKDFNLLIDKYLVSFITKNQLENKVVCDELRVSFKVLGIVLDSPYDSFSGFVRDNMKKAVTVLTGLISSPVLLYLKNFYKNRLGVDLDRSQNIDLIKRINVNTVFLVSTEDELIPMEKFNEMTDNYASACPKKNKCKVYNTKQKHGKKRPNDLMVIVFKHLLTSPCPKNTYQFTHIQKGMNKLFETKTVQTTQYSHIKLIKGTINNTPIRKNKIARSNSNIEMIDMKKFSFHEQVNKTTTEEASVINDKEIKNLIQFGQQLGQKKIEQEQLEQRYVTEQHVTSNKMRQSKSSNIQIHKIRSSNRNFVLPIRPINGVNKIKNPPPRIMKNKTPFKKQHKRSEEYQEKINIFNNSKKKSED